MPAFAGMTTLSEGPYRANRPLRRNAAPRRGPARRRLAPEALPPAARARLVLHVSDAGLLPMPVVARKVAAFLRSGRFAR